MKGKENKRRGEEKRRKKNEKKVGDDSPFRLSLISHHLSDLKCE